ncbi:hypothetical protein [Paenibacillus sp. UNC217MF]|uniref:hypothetical protein n=1 Tax=Paenibacillus sp. UNC217MF TaxID=1449062 RepID=UPI00068CEEC7|nr:hypothetical protein [Paenibacillus sp. UNC217MF]
MQRKNIITLKNISLAFLLFYTVLCLVITVTNNKAFDFVYYRFNPNVEKIHVELQVTTGPMYYLDDTKSIETLKKIYPEIDTYDIKLKGETPYKNADDPAEIGDLTVYGKFNGVTDEYKGIGYGEIPVFEVKYYDDLYYLLNEVLSSPLLLFTIMTSPIVVIILLCYSVYFSKKAILEIIKRTVGSF